jgi:hypothetical protein
MTVVLIAVARTTSTNLASFQGLVAAAHAAVHGYTTAFGPRRTKPLEIPTP